MPYPPITPKRLEGAQPLCPLHGMPPMERAWSAKPGETVFLRMPEGTRPLAYEDARATLDRATKECGVFFLLLAPGVEVVPPDDADA
jgi:hypothetical protein